VAVPPELPAARPGDAGGDEQRGGPRAFAVRPPVSPPAPGGPPNGAAEPWRVHPAGVPGHHPGDLAGPDAPPSQALAAVVEAGIVERLAAAEHLLVLGFDGEGAGREVDLRPALPVVLRW
jgi:hypothetical protein